MILASKNRAMVRLVLVLSLVFTKGSMAAVNIDVIALYSPSAETLFSDTPTRIEALFTEANQIHLNSETGITLSPVLIMPYNRPNTSFVNSAALGTMESDPVLSRLRSTYGADLVVLFTESASNICGLGRLGQGNPIDGITPFEFNRDATSLSASAIDCDGQTLAHEIGHNFGLSHSAAQGATGEIAEYGRGHGVNDSFSTIMAYSSFFGSAVSLNRFSKSDDNSCLGQACGIAPGLENEADSFLAMALVDEDIASYFQAMEVSSSQDTDGDKMTDTWEWENGLNGFIASDAVQDLDLDGWSNVQEFYAQTDPRNASSFPVAGTGDSDDDGILDPQDAFPFDPNETVDSDNDKVGNNSDMDDDGDGMDDDFEAFHGYDPLAAEDASEDSDSDGATNLQEYQSGSDPESSLSSPSNQQLFRLSKSTTGSQGNEESGVPLESLNSPLAISRNGQTVVFESKADNLVIGDENFATDIFLHDRVTRTTSMVSMDSDGQASFSDSFGPSLAKDTNKVAFATAAALVSSDNNGIVDIYTRDMVNELTDLISISSQGGQSNSSSGAAAISADGQLVVFHSFANSLVENDSNGRRDVFLHDTVGLETTLMSYSAQGLQGNSNSESPQISDDGAKVIFHSFATSLLANDENGGFPDIFVLDIEAGETSVLSIDSDGEQTNGNSFHPAISQNGRWIAFQSDSFGLVPGISNNNVDIFLHDSLLGRTTRVSVSSSGEQSNGDSKNASISDDGQYIVFESAASNLVNGDTNQADDIFLHDTQTGETTILSKNLSGDPSNGDSRNPKISGDGSAVAFTSYATDLVYWDQNAQADVFVVKTARAESQDMDDDGVADSADNCISIANVNQLDTDNDGLGDRCDPDDDNDGIADENDAFSLISIGNLVDSDNDGAPNDCDSNCQALGMQADLDDDNDGVSDNLDALPLDPLESVDTDGDGIGNNTDLDDDNDGISDIDEIANGSDPLDPNSVSGEAFTLLAYDDSNNDGIPDWLAYEVTNTEIQIIVLSGADFATNLNELNLPHSFEAGQLHLLDDRTGDGIREMGVFGFDPSTNRFQLLAYNGVNGLKLGTWNWPRILSDVSFEPLKDLTEDGVQEYAIMGIHLVNGTRQLVVKNGQTRSNYQTFKWPNLWTQTKIVTLSDRTGDGIPEVGLYGVHVRLGKGQLFVYDGASANTKVDVYNWNRLWDHTELIEMDDVDGEGTIDWGQFGKRKDDGRYQWVIKKGHDKRGVIRTFSWPADLENVSPILVADRTGDGVRDVAITGTHNNNGKIFLRINDGKLANQRIANISWPANWENLEVKELGDLNDDGFNEYSMLGYLKANHTVQLVIKDGQSLTEYGRYTLEGSYQDLMLDSYDVNGDGVADVILSGLNQDTEVRDYKFLNGTTLEVFLEN